MLVKIVYEGSVIHECLYIYPRTEPTCVCICVYVPVWCLIYYGLFFFFLDKDHCTFQMTPAWGKSRVLMIETDKVSPSLPHVIYENASSPQSARDRVCWLLGNPRHLLNPALVFLSRWMPTAAALPPVLWLLLLSAVCSVSRWPAPVRRKTTSASRGCLR